MKLFCKIKLQIVLFVLQFGPQARTVQEDELVSRTYLSMIKEYGYQDYLYQPRLCQQDVEITLRHTFDILICVYYEIISLATVRVK